MKRAIPVVLALLLLALLAWRSGIGARQLRHYAPDEYVERAERFIRAGYLAADCSRDPIRLVPRLADAPAHERSWYGDSYLAADVELFNADPEGFGWAFAIDGDCQLRGVNPVVHAIQLPFVREVRWLGDFLYQGEGSDAVLRSARRSITLRHSDAPVPTRKQATTRVGGGDEVVKQGVVLVHFAGGPGQPAARLFPIGGDVVVHNRVRSGRPEEVRLMGHQLPVGMMSRLATGDWLHFEAESPARVEETFVYVGGEALEAASRVRRQNERYERKTEDSGLGLGVDAVRETTRPFLDQVASSLDTVLQVLPAERSEELAQGFDVQLTVRRDLQLALSRTFRGHCDKLRREQDAEPFAGGVTVMDGASGELLALATFPHEEDLEGDDLDARTRRRLLRNQNFVRHPIGSAGKPFFFAAVADAYPELLRFEVGGHEEMRRHRDVFHCEIPTGYQLLAGHGERVDFRTALEASCNKYTIELATLAFAADLSEGRSIAQDREIEWPLPGAGAAAWIGGRPLDFAPDLGGYVFVDEREPEDEESTAAVACVNLDRMEQVRYRNVLERLTGAATYRGRVPQGLPQEATRSQLEQGYATNRYDLSIWGSLVEHVMEGVEEDRAWRIRAALQEVSPDRVNLAFNQVSQLRADFVSLLLGGGSSIWTNVQLAEAMSRLVTGRAVEARLASRVIERRPKVGAPQGGDVATPPEELGLGSEARRAVLDGMERVVAGERGTATELRGALAELRKAFPGDEIELYSKTGSPVLESSVPGAVATALERLVTRSRLSLQGGALTVASGSAAAPHRRRGERGRTEYLNALSGALGEVGFPGGGRVLRTVRDVVDRFADDRRRNRVVPGEPDGPLWIERGGLRINREDALFRGRLMRELGAVYLFTIVRRPGGRASEERVVTVALHVEIGPDSRVAVGAAQAILPELAAVLE